MTLRCFQQHPLFNSLTAEQWDGLRVAVHEQRLDENQLLFKQGDISQHFFFVISGHIKLYRLNRNGEEKVIEIVKPLETFAEAVMFMPEPRYPVNAQSLNKQSCLLRIDNQAYLDILGESFSTTCHIIKDLSCRLHKWVNEIEYLSLKNATYRVINYLLAEVQQNADSAPKNSVYFNIPKHIIASRLSIQPETFSRILSSLHKEKLIKLQGRSVQILDIDKLRLFI